MGRQNPSIFLRFYKTPGFQEPTGHDIVEARLIASANPVVFPSLISPAFK
jgi:hypothetical protein